MSVELGVGYVSIVPETSKITPGITAALRGAGGAAQGEGQSIGSRLASGMGKTLKVGAAAAGASAAAVVGTALAKGFTRLNAVEQAETKLRGLGKAAGEITTIMDGVSQAVTGTAFGLDEAASSAAKFSAVGVKSGDDLNRTLTMTADIATQAGTSMDDISSVLAKVAGQGRVTAQELNQLDDRAVGASAALADHLGVSLEEVRAKVSAGEVDFATFSAAMEAHLGGAAQRSGETFVGAFANMNAALGRFGEKLLSPAFVAGPAIFGALGGAVDAVNKAITPATEQIGNALAPAFERLAGVIGSRVTPALADGAARFGEFAVTLVEAAVDPANWEWLGRAFESLASSASAAAPAIASLAGAMARTAGAVTVQVWVALGNVLQALAPIIQNVLVPVLHTVAALTERHPGLVQAMVYAWAGMKAVAGVSAILAGVNAALAFGRGVMAAYTAGTYGMAAAQSGLIPALAASIGMIRGKAVAENISTAAALRAVVAEKAKAIALKAGAIATKVVTAAQWAWNAALTANPIGLVIAAVAALVAGLVWFFTKTETGKAIWSGFMDVLRSAWEWIKGVFAPVWDWLKETMSRAWEGIKNNWKTLLAVFAGPMGVVIGQIVTHWDTIKSAAGTAFDWIRTKWEEFTTGFGQFYDTWVRPVVEGFQLAWQLAGQGVGIALDWISQKWSDFTTGIGVVWAAVGQPVFDIMTIGAQNLGLLLSGVWQAIQIGFQLVGTVIQTVWSAVVSVVWSAMQLGAQILGAALSGVWQVIQAGFQFVGSIVQSVWANIIQPVFGFFQAAAGLLADVLTGNFGNIRNRFSEMGNSISQVVRGPINVAMDAMKAAVRLAGDAWNAFRNTVGQVVSAVRGRVNEMVNVIREVPNRIRSAFSNAGTWLVQAGKNIIGGLIDGIRSMAGAVMDAVSNLTGGISLGFGGGGFFAGGGFHAYARGGINAAEQYANGGHRRPTGFLPDQARIAAPRGARGIVQWAEGETGGEAFIPLAQGKRPRSTAILAKTADLFGMALVDKATGEPVVSSYRGGLGPTQVGVFNNGGFRPSVRDVLNFVHGRTPIMTRSLEGSPYVWGGGASPANWGDCSGMVSMVAGYIAGKWRNSGARRLFATGSQGQVLRQLGFTMGRRTGPDIFSTGWFNGGPYGGHTSASIGNTNIEMGGGRGNGQIGGRAAGANHPQYREHAWIQLAGEAFKSAVSGSGTAGIPNVGPDGSTVPASQMAAMGTVQSMAEDKPKTWSDITGKAAKDIVSGFTKDALGVFGIPDELPPIMQAFNMMQDAEKHGGVSTWDVSTAAASLRRLEAEAELKRRVVREARGAFNTIKNSPVGDPDWQVMRAAEERLRKEEEALKRLEKQIEQAEAKLQSMIKTREDATKAGQQQLTGSESNVELQKIVDTPVEPPKPAEVRQFASQFVAAKKSAQWRPTIEKVLKAKNQPLSFVDAVIKRGDQESGGNPKAINNWDSNAKAGTPSKGWMQVIDPTFKAYKDAGFGNIWEVEDNLRASMNYALRDPKYKGRTLQQVYLRAGGYRMGGWITGGSGVRDDVPLVAQGGEFIVHQKAAMENRALLERINAGQKIDLATSTPASGDTFHLYGIGEDLEDAVARLDRRQKQRALSRIGSR